MAGSYTVASAVEDIFVLSHKLFLKRPDSPRSAIEMSRYKNVFLSKDIIL
jgi:hypothetical protein